MDEENIGFRRDAFTVEAVLVSPSIIFFLCLNNLNKDSYLLPCLKESRAPSFKEPISKNKKKKEKKRKKEKERKKTSPSR